MLKNDIQQVFLGNKIIVQLTQTRLVFSRIHVSLSYWCHNVHTLGLSHVFTTHGSGYAMSLGDDVPNIYRLNRIHIAKL